MRLPRAQEAIVDPEKVRDYLLSPRHATGRQKARFFARLGYVQANWRRLRADLCQLAREHDVTTGRPSVFGSKYELRATLIGPSGRSAEIVAIWIVLKGEEFPRLVTAFPGDTP
jgi:hypothetical protein